jgi:hypothetical protein
MDDAQLIPTSSAVPLLTLVEPAAAGDVIEAAAPTFRVAGQARPGAVVSVEGDLIDLAEDGTFAEVALDDGLNQIEVVATDPDTEEEVAITLLVVFGQ